jgi:hypothetical protein
VKLFNEPNSWARKHLCLKMSQSVKQPFMFHYPSILPVWSLLPASEPKLNGKQLKHSETEAAQATDLKHSGNIPKHFDEKVKPSVTTDLSHGPRNRGRLDHLLKSTLDLTRIRARMAEKPRTKAGQIRQAWPDIKALFDAGHSLKDIWMWLNEIGIEIGYARLSYYTGQLKRRDKAAAPAATATLVSEPPVSASTEKAVRKTRTEPQKSPAPDDPLANIREHEDRRPGFQYNPEPDVKKLI